LDPARRRRQRRPAGAPPRAGGGAGTPAERGCPGGAVADGGRTARCGRRRGRRGGARGAGRPRAPPVPMAGRTRGSPPAPARGPRLSQWLEDDAAGRRLRRRLTPAAADWDAHARPDADLYRGPRLVEALDWQAQHQDELIPAEREFLDASARAAERERLDALA